MGAQPDLAGSARISALGLAGAITAKDRFGGRLGLIPFQFLLVGPLLTPFCVAGLVRLLRNPQARPFRAFAVAYLAMLVILLIAGGNALYMADGFPALLAAGGIATREWLGRAQSRMRPALLSLAVLLAVVSGAVIGLPVIPVADLRADPALVADKEPGETVGWPQLANTVVGAYRALPESDQARTVVIATNYGEAGALERYGYPLGLPPVFSGHNGYGEWGPPPDSNQLTIVVGGSPGIAPQWTSACRDLRQIAILDNGYRLHNDEQGRPVWLCRGLAQPWSVVWPHLRQLN